MEAAEEQIWQKECRRNQKSYGEDYVQTFALENTARDSIIGMNTQNNERCHKEGIKKVAEKKE